MHFDILREYIKSYNGSSINSTKMQAGQKLYFEDKIEDPTTIDVWYEMLKIELIDLKNVLVCTVKDHQYRGDPGPEGFHVCCDRCGYSYSGYMN